MALTVAQNSQRKLAKTYVGEHLLNQDGELYEICGIAVRGFYGNSFGRKLLSVLTGVQSIAVELKQQSQLSLNELKDLVSRFIQYDAQTPEPLLPQRDLIERVIERIQAARSVPELFLAFDMPALEDCLDVL